MFLNMKKDERCHYILRHIIAMTHTNFCGLVGLQFDASKNTDSGMATPHVFFNVQKSISTELRNPDYPIYVPLREFGSGVIVF